MNGYTYQHPLDDHTRKILLEFDTERWIILIERILEELSPQLNIEFDESSPDARLKQLFDIINTFKIPKRPYFSALVNVLKQYYGNIQKGTEIFCLIKAIDYSRPLSEFNELILLVGNPQFQNMLKVQASDTFSIHFHLIHAIMHFDDKLRLYDYLMSLNMSSQPREYFQICIRYLYSQLGNEQDKFDKYMRRVSKYMGNELILQFIIKGLREYAQMFRSFDLIYFCLFNARDERIFGEIEKYFYYWLTEEKQKLRSYRNFNPLYLFLCTSLNKDYPLHYLGELVASESMIAKDKGKLLRYTVPKKFNQRKDSFHYSDLSGSCDLIFHNGYKLSIPPEYEELSQHIDVGFRDIIIGSVKAGREEMLIPMGAN